MPELNPYEAPQTDLKDPQPKQEPARQPQIDFALLFALMLQVIAIAATALNWLGSILAVWGNDIQRHDLNTLIAASVAAVLTVIVIVLASRKGKHTLVFFESGLLGLLGLYLMASFVF